jgi:ABC-type antimicrobial peptide transport system permease subunit
LLTIFGITIGVLALVVMGSIAEKLQLLVDGGVKYYADKVIVTDATTFAGFGIAPIESDVRLDAERIDGIERGSVVVNFLLEEDLSAVSMGTPPMVEGTDFRDQGYENFETWSELTSSTSSVRRWARQSRSGVSRSRSSASTNARCPRPTRPSR